MTEFPPSLLHSFHSFIPSILHSSFPSPLHSFIHSSPHSLITYHLSSCLCREDKPSPPAAPAEGPFPHLVTLCVSPLKEAGVRARAVREFVEYHRLLGVSHFDFYDAGFAGSLAFESHFQHELDTGLVRLVRLDELEGYDVSLNVSNSLLSPGCGWWVGERKRKGGV